MKYIFMTCCQTVTRNKVIKGTNITYYSAYKVFTPLDLFPCYCFYKWNHSQYTIYFLKLSEVKTGFYKVMSVFQKYITENKRLHSYSPPLKWLT